MGAKTKVAEVWRDTTIPYVKVASSWNIARSAWTKVSGVWNFWFLQGGLRNPKFTLSGVNSRVRTIAIQPDNKIFIGGDFTVFDGLARGRIARLNSDGTIDSDFNSSMGLGTPTSFGNEIHTIVIQPDGKILIGGQFTTFSGSSANRILRLNSDGTRDTAFSSNISAGATATVRSIKLQSDGKIIVAGDFLSFNGNTVNRLARLNSDGTFDTAFATNTGTGADSIVWSVAIQSDGKIVLTGIFTSFNGSSANRLIRLNSDGTIDTEFLGNIGSGLSSIGFAIDIQSDQKILLGGDFDTFNSNTTRRVVRLNTDGTLDSSFNANTNIDSTVTTVLVQPDQKIIITGVLHTFQANGQKKIMRLNSDGTIDTGFSNNLGSGLNNIPWSSALVDNDTIIVGGDFTLLNGASCNRIASISTDVSP
jgi:uncharacterized delta-60 repeat protein